MPKYLDRDGVQIPYPTDEEMEAFKAWYVKNGMGEWDHPDQHYDYVGAFRAGEDRGSGGHLTDLWKLPGHKTFSVESNYWEPNMKSGYWVEEKYHPINDISEIPDDILNGILTQKTKRKKKK